jgi:hypothetical protein
LSNIGEKIVVALGVIAFVAFSFLVMWALEMGAEEKVREATGSKIVSIEPMLIGCGYSKHRHGYRFRAENGRTGKLCTGAMIPDAITYDQ